MSYWSVLPSDAGWRKLPCGCWERHIVGDIVTSHFDGWVVGAGEACPEHARKPRDTAAAASVELDTHERPAHSPPASVHQSRPALLGSEQSLQRSVRRSLYSPGRVAPVRPGLGGLIPLSVTEAPAKPKCSALNKAGEPCKAPRANGTELCAGHLGLGIAANPAAYAKAGNNASAASRQARAEARQQGFTDVLAAQLHKEREALAAQWIAEGKRDWRATEGALTRLFGKPKETVEVSGGLDLTAMSREERQALVQQALSDPDVLELLPAQFRLGA